MEIVKINIGDNMEQKTCKICVNNKLRLRGREMGYFEHKTIVVTGEGLHFDNAYKKAKELFNIDNEGKKVNMVSNIVGTGMNQYYSFFISPSGSKVGWEMDKYFNKKIDEMINYLNSSDCKFSDGSSFNSWFLAEYGETGRRIKKSNCKNLF